MKITEKQNRIVETVKDVLCDCCGKSCKVDEGIIDNPIREDHGQKYYSFEYMDLSAVWGYHSNKDLEKYSAQVCEKCVDEKFSFIKFKKSSYHPFHHDKEI